MLRAAALAFVFFVMTLSEVHGDEGRSGPGQLPAPVAKFLDAYCLSCHDKETSKGDVVLEDLVKLPPDKKMTVLDDMQEQVFSGEMPPKKKKQPSNEERAEILAWLSSELASSKASKLEDKLRYYRYGNLINHEELFATAYDKLPKEFLFMRELLLSALWRSPEKWGLAEER